MQFESQASSEHLPGEPAKLAPEEMLHTAGSYVQSQLRERPYRTLGVAMGIGYLLGGGLTLRTASLLWSVGSQILPQLMSRDFDGHGASQH
jgi:hypothetical protein